MFIILLIQPQHFFTPPWSLLHPDPSFIHIHPPSWSLLHPYPSLSLLHSDPSLSWPPISLSFLDTDSSSLLITPPPWSLLNPDPPLPSDPFSALIPPPSWSLLLPDPSSILIPLQTRSLPIPPYPDPVSIVKRLHPDTVSILKPSDTWTLLPPVPILILFFSLPWPLVYLDPSFTIILSKTLVQKQLKYFEVRKVNFSRNFNFVNYVLTNNI